MLVKPFWEMKGKKKSLTVLKANNKKYGKPLTCQGNKVSQKLSLY